MCAQNTRSDLVPAAIVPICGGCDFIDVTTGNLLPLKNFHGMGIWHFHSIKDYVVSYQSGVRTLNRIIPGNSDVMEGYPTGTAGDLTVSYNDATGFGEWKEGAAYPSGRISLTLFAEGGHGIGDTVNDNPELWDWLYDQRRE